MPYRKFYFLILKFSLFSIPLAITDLRKKIMKYDAFPPAVSKVCLKFPLYINVHVHDHTEENKRYMPELFENKNVT
jgi:hypothetical protein